MKGSNVFMLALCAGTAVAVASPITVIDCVAANGGNMIGDHAAGVAGNSVVLSPVVSAATVHSVRIQGQVSAWLAATYNSECRVLLTSPLGFGVAFQVLPTPATGNPAAPTSFDVSTNVPWTAANGTWRIETYESFDDTGIDATYDQLSVTLDDADFTVPPTPPAAFTDMGDLSAAISSVDQNVVLTAATDIQWFKVVLPECPVGGAGYVDMWTTPTSTTVLAIDMTNPDMAMYENNSGVIRILDTADGPANHPQFSFGSTASRGTTTFGALAAGVARDGRDGGLGGGTYWVAIGNATTFTAPFTGYNVTSTSTSTQRNTVLHVRTQPNTVPVPPSIGATTCTPASSVSGQTRLLTAVVNPGANPSSAITSVVSDLSTVGGPLSAAFHNDGLNGDVSAADNIWSYSLAGATAAVGPYTLTITATDAIARSGSNTVTMTFVDPPATFTDVGNFSTGVHSYSATTAEAATPTWFKVVLPAMPAGGLAWADFYCTTTDVSLGTVPVGDSVDPDLALYDSSGTKLVSDDLDGPGFWAQISCGSTVVNRGVTPTFAGQAAGIAKNGYDGPLAGGTYWLAQGHYSMAASANGFAAVVGAAGGNTVVHIETSDGLSPTNPVLSAASATPASGASGSPVTINVTVTPGANPTSGTVTVTANLTALGGGASVAMTDPELDGIYSVSTTIPAGASDFSTYSVQIDAVDDYTTPRHAAPVFVTVGGQATPVDEATLAGADAGDSLATAGVFSGSGAMNAIVGSTTNVAGGDAADVYKIQICDEAAFIADTKLVAGDTQLFLFDSNGMGIVANDDTTGLSAKLDSTLVTANGEYYLAVTRYNVDPSDATPAAIWTSNAGQAAPVATAGALASWSDATTATSQGAYRISLAGVCFPTPAQCSPADVGVQGGGAGQDRLLNNNDFIAFIDLFFAQSPQADLGGQGGVQGADNAWDNNDFIVFIDYFFNDAANCQG